MLVLFRVRITAETVMEYDVYKFPKGLFFARRRDVDWSGSGLLKAVGFWKNDSGWYTTDADNNDLVRLIGAEIESSETLDVIKDHNQICI